MFLNKLIEDLGIKKEYSKAVLAAVVMSTLESNKCGITAENKEDVIEKLIDGICGRYEFDIASLAASWCNDTVCILAMNEPSINTNTIFKDHIWPYLTENEIVPGVKMK